MNTSYDEIYSTFMDNNLAEDIILPNHDWEMYRFINNGIRFYNNEERDDIKGNDIEESVDRKLDNDEILIIAHYIRYAFLKNQLTAFVTTWQPFEKDMGMKNYAHQRRGMELVIADCLATIIRLRHNKEDDIF